MFQNLYHLFMKVHSPNSTHVGSMILHITLHFPNIALHSFSISIHLSLNKTLLKLPIETFMTMHFVLVGLFK